MKILLLGKNGQIGYALQHTLADLGTVVAPSRDELNLTSDSQLLRYLNQLQPDMIINAAAYTDVDAAETAAQLTQRVNAHAVATLAEFSARTGILLVHYSSDYVFDGEKKNNYIETDIANPLNVYGLSKLHSEGFIQSSGCHALIFRTSWVHSERSTNFVKTILRLAQEKSSLSVVNDQEGAPTSAKLIADITCLALQRYYDCRLSPGIYHLTASGSTTWYDFACYIIEQALSFNMPLSLGLNDLFPIASADYNALAKRPKNSKLDCSLLEKKLGIQLPHWRIDVLEILERLATNQ